MSALVKQNNPNNSSNLMQYVDGQLVPVASATPTNIPTLQQSQNKELTIHDILAIINRRKWSIILPIIITVTLALIYTLSTPPSYRANALVQIEREGINIFPEGGLSASLRQRRKAALPTKTRTS